MLYLLRFLILVLVLSPVNVFAGNRFFEFDIDYFEQNKTETGNTTGEDSCHSCDVSLEKRTGDLFPKTNRPNKYSRKPLKQIDGQSGIYLFINPECHFCDAAIQELIKFKDSHSTWATEVFVVSSVDDFDSFIRQGKEYFSHDVIFTFDLQSKYSEKFNITQVPTFVIFYRGSSYYKIAGHIKLNETIKRIKAK